MEKKHDYSNTALFVDNKMMYSFYTRNTMRFMSHIYSLKFRPYVLSCKDKEDRVKGVAGDWQEIKFGFVVKKIFDKPRLLVHDGRGNYYYSARYKALTGDNN